jgi:hypothetical protein
MVLTATAPLVNTAPSTVAGIITASATVLTALGGVILAISVLIPNLRLMRRTANQVETVHTIVNQQRTDQQRYNIALVQLLKKNGIEVPVDQSLPVSGVPDANKVATFLPKHSSESDS